MKKRLTAILTIIILIFGALPSGLTTYADSMAVYVVINTLEIYSKPSDSSTVLGVMAYGEKMTRDAVSGDWMRVKNSDDKTGYCKSISVSVNDPNQYSSAVYISCDKARIYKKPAESSKVMARLPIGSEYTCVAVTADGEWYRLKNGKHFGYVKAENISAVPVFTDKADAKVYVSANLLTIYQSASESSKPLAVMPFGTGMHCAYVSGDWACVKSEKGSTGFCSVDGLAKSNPCNLSLTVYINADNVRIYRKPDENSKKSSLLKFNACYTAIGKTGDGEWYRLKNGDHYGYVKAAFLSDTPCGNDNGTGEAPAFVTDTILQVYGKPDTASPVLGNMCFGEQLVCVGTKSGWAKVRNSAGAIGYCSTSGLSLKDPNFGGTAAFVQSSGTKVYVRPDKASSVITTLNVNAQVTAVAVSGDKKWVRVKNGGSYGYILSSKLGKQVSSASGGKSDSITNLTRSLLGKRCVYGAEGPEKFDCSGLVVYVYKTVAGIDLERTAFRQGYDKRYKTISSIEDLKPGDLVFFNTDRTFVEGGDIDLCDSVGIYMGEKTFIYSSAIAGKVIMRTLEDDSFYCKNFSWGKRILK